jgi:hypothetical protein
MTKYTELLTLIQIIILIILKFSLTSFLSKCYLYTFVNGKVLLTL